MSRCLVEALDAFAGDDRCVTERYPTSSRYGLQQNLQPVANERAGDMSVVRKSSASQQQHSEHTVSAAEQLLMHASATTTFPEAFCRSNSRDSGIGKDSDNGSSTSSTQMTSRPSQTLTQERQYVEDLCSPQHLYSQSSSQAPNQPVCTVLPMTQYGRNPNDITVRHCNTSRYPNSQHANRKPYQCMNWYEMFSGKSLRMTGQPGAPPEFDNSACRDGKQHSGNQFPMAQNGAYYGNVVNPSHYNGSGRLEVPDVCRLLHLRDSTNTQPVRYATAGMPGSDRDTVMDCIPVARDVTASPFVSEHCLTGTDSRASMFDYGHGRRARSRLACSEIREDMLYREPQNMNAVCQFAVHSHHDGVDAPRYHAVQQRYQPYDVSANIRNCHNSVPHGGTYNPFYQASPRSVMNCRQNFEMFYSSHTSGIR